MAENNTRKDILWRLYLSFAAIALVGILISAQIVKLQYIEGDKLRAEIDSLRTKNEVIEPKRGSIYSERGDLLATSFPYFDVYMDPVAPSDQAFKKNIDSLSIRLSKLFGDKSAAQYKQKIVQARKQKKRYIEIQKNVTYPEKTALQNFPLFRLGKNAGGLITQQIEKRAYPYSSLANRTIGYVKESGKKIGLEGTYDSLLTGKPGYSLMRKVAGGSWIRVSDENEIDPVDGLDIITTLDINMQDITETALRKSLVENNAAWGTAIVMEVKTGQIKSIVNLTRTETGYREIYNYAISERVEPGSTWKLFSLMCMLEDGLTIKDHVDLNNGSWPFADRTMYDSEPHHRRDVTVKTAFALSSNVGISRLASKYYQADPEKYTAHLIESGIVNKTGIEIPGELKPVFKTNPSDKNNWYKTTIPWMSVGYELQITPMQLATFYNGIANNGKMMKPYLVSETQRFGETVDKFDPIVLNEKLCSEQTIKQLKECLEAVVDSGTAKHLKNNYYRFAGKTGTAQIYENEKHAYGDKYLASFAGYFPAENPKYTCVVIVNAPSNHVYYGGYVAAPVFREVADKVYSHFINMREPVNEIDSLSSNITAGGKGNAGDYREVLKWFGVNDDFNDQDEWVAFQTDHNQISSNAIQENPYAMPDVKGMGLRDAVYLLEKNGLKVDAIGVGKVISQSIQPGQPIANGNYVMIQLN